MRDQRGRMLAPPEKDRVSPKQAIRSGLAGGDEIMTSREVDEIYELKVVRCEIPLNIGEERLAFV